MSGIEKLLMTMPELTVLEILIPEDCALCLDETGSQIHVLANEDGTLDCIESV